jgi:hypothetical protein
MPPTSPSNQKVAVAAMMFATTATAMTAGGEGIAVISFLIVRRVEGTADHEEKQKGRSRLRPTGAPEAACGASVFPDLVRQASAAAPIAESGLCGFVRSCTDRDGKTAP